MMPTPDLSAARPPPLVRLADVRPARVLALPALFALALLALCGLPSAHSNPALLWSFSGAGAALLSWNAALMIAALRSGRRLTLELILRSQHYVQACAQLSVLVYWGWYWREVYQSAHLIVAQLLFAYALDALIAWTRRDTHTLGFGPFPIIFSINLFLWFKPDWFFLQFVLVALGFAAKELIRWNKGGRRAHIFNPSSFPLALFSVALLLTDTTHLTWGEAIAYTQLYPPHIYWLIFLVALPGQLLFGVTLMTMSAVVTAFACILLWVAAHGDGFLVETYIPIATFLGMHLLFNDPSTSPRTDLGRIFFGVLYGLSVVVLYALLEWTGTASFYDKLLAVPILNLLIQGIDRIASSRAMRRVDPTAWLARLAPRRKNLAYIAVWAAAFAIIQSQTSADQELARLNRLALSSLAQGQIAGALSRFREAAERGDAIAQSNLGVLYASGEGLEQDEAEAVRWYRKSAERGYDPAQFNLGQMHERGAGVAQDFLEAARWYRKAAQQGNADAQYHLGALYATGRGVARNGAEAARWYRAAAEGGHAAAQSDLGVLHALGRGVPQDYAEAARWYLRAAEQGYADAQFNLGVLYTTGWGVAQDDAQAARWYREAALQGNADAQYNLGFLHAAGRGVAQDLAEAERWYRLAAAQGHTEAQCKLGRCPRAHGELEAAP